MGFILSAFADESSNALSGQIDALKRNGYSYLEIRNLDGMGVADLTVSQAKEVLAKLQDAGIGIMSIGSPVGKIQLGDDFSAHMNRYRHVLELANVFGAKYIRLFSFFMPKDENPDLHRDLVLERMSVIAKTAQEYGVIACHENEKGIFGDNARRCLEMYQAIPELRAVFDPANFVQCGQDTLQAWEMLSPYVEYMHIKDALPDGQIVAPGQGAGNVAALLKKYAAKGGQLLTLEPHLFEFAGLKGLEQEGDESIVGQMSFETSEAAFDYAVGTLNTILEEIL